MKILNYTRREALKISGLASLATIIPSSLFSENIESVMSKRIILSTGEKIPIVGLGTWQTFDVGNSLSARNTLIQVLKEMHKNGGSIIDCPCHKLSCKK